jgi:tetratricopeptide (TPR) repeat protein
MRSRSTLSTDAYDAYLRGRFHWNRRTQEGLELSLELFRQAIQHDPDYAEAYAGVADAQAMLAGYGIAPGQQLCPEAEAAASRAIELDPDLGAPHASLAFILTFCDHDWAGAEEHFRRALELEPDYPTAHHWYAWSLAGQRRFDEALRRLDRAQELNPLSLIIGSAAGWIYASAGLVDRAEAQFRRMLEMDAQFPRTHLWLSSVLALEGRSEEAVEHARIGVRLTNRHPQYLSGLAFALGRAGRQEEARELIRELQDRASYEFVAAFDVAIAYLGAGDIEAALSSLEEAYRGRGIWMSMVAMDPRIQVLREHPRFLVLLSNLGLPAMAG